MRNQDSRALNEVAKHYREGKQCFADLSDSEKSSLAIKMLQEGYQLELTKSLHALASFMLFSDSKFKDEFIEESKQELVESAEDYADALFGKIHRQYMEDFQSKYPHKYRLQTLKEQLDNYQHAA
jgi:hypothetical protein